MATVQISTGKKPLHKSEIYRLRRKSQNIIQLFSTYVFQTVVNPLIHGCVFSS